MRVDVVESGRSGGFRMGAGDGAGAGGEGLVREGFALQGQLGGEVSSAAGRWRTVVS